MDAMSDLRRAVAYAGRERKRYIKELQAFMRFPSVSTQPEHAADVARCARWLAGRLAAAGLQEVNIVPTPRHPAVTAGWRGAPGRPTLLIYGHYDVQPAGGPEGWNSPPFDPAVRGQYLYGRGASDDKGQIMAHIAALEALLKTAGRLPLNVACLFEGEEEIGSPNLGGVVDRLEPFGSPGAPQLAVISDTAIPAPEQPALIYALRGKLEMEVELHGTRRELHSGAFGGALENPAQALARALAGLQTPQGRVEAPGFYSQVRRWPAGERAYMRRVGPSDADVLRNAGAETGWGEPGYTLYERTTIRPALSINGLTSGYQGRGGKGIIPPRASAKLDVRLVPDQDPDQIAGALEETLRTLLPGALRPRFIAGNASGAVYLNRRDPAMRAAARAYASGFGRAPVFLRSGGSIPVVRMLVDRYAMPVVLLGFGLPDDCIHAANERFYLPNLFRGIHTVICFLHNAACPRRENP